MHFFEPFHDLYPIKEPQCNAFTWHCQVIKYNWYQFVHVNVLKMLEDLENVSYKDSTLCTPDSWVTDMARFNQTHTHTRTHAQTYTHTASQELFFMAAECHHGATPALAAPQLCSRVFWPAAQISPLLNYEWTSWLRWVPSFPLIPSLSLFIIPLNEQAPLLLPSENNWMHVERV